MMSSRALLASLVALGTVACNDGQAPSEPSNVASSPPAKSQASSGTFLVAQASAPPGTTNLGTSPAILFTAPGFRLSEFDPDDSLHKHLSVVVARASFVSRGGDRVAAAAQTEGSAIVESPAFSLRPVEALRDVEWYRLEIEEDEALQVQNDPSHSKLEPVRRLYSTHFFTASAPRVRAAERASSKPAAAIRVEFSEPIEVATLRLNDLVRHQGIDIGACIQLNGSCSMAPISAQLGAVEVVLTKPLPDPPGEVELWLGSGTQGSVGQTVADGVQKAGGKMKKAGLEDVLVSIVDPTSWANCQAGAAKCWISPPPDEF